MGKKSGKAKDNVKKAALLDPEGECGLSDKFCAVLREVFARFDVDKDGGLSKDELQNFAVAANAGSNLEEDEVQQLQQFFETDSNGYLTQKGFFQMYQMQTTARSSDTWKDLQRLGYKPNLAPLHAAGGESDATVSEKPANEQALKDELRAALMELKGQPCAAAHLRVASALESLGRHEAAANSRQQAASLEGKSTPAAEPSSVEEND